MEGETTRGAGAVLHNGVGTEEAATGCSLALPAAPGLAAKAVTPPPEGGNLLPPSAGELIEAEKKWQSIPYTGRGGKASQGDAHSTCTAEANAPDEHLV